MVATLHEPPHLPTHPLLSTTIYNRILPHPSLIP